MLRPARPTRFAAVARWAGSIICGLLVVAWGVSPLLGLRYCNGENGYIMLARGGLIIFRLNPEETKAWLKSGYGGIAPAGLRVGKVDVGPTIWLPRSQYDPSLPGAPNPVPSMLWIWTPLWLPFVLVAIPTALLWRAELRRRRAERVGRCPSCGYDQSGLAAGAQCPECGAPARS